MHINDLLKIAVERKASDLHLKVSAFPVIRIDGALVPLSDMRRLMQEDTIAMAFSIMSARQKEKFKNNFEIDIAYNVPNLGRFRCNIFQQRGTVGLVLRVIPMQIRTIEELMLPPVLKKIAEEERGLVLVTGTTGSGKSTTLAALIDYVNRTRTAHVMTVEDPIEFLHRDQRSIINQREVTVDTRSFAQALRSALRQDPDVILVGEMRDFETVETALLAAETGHLVLSTLHTNDAPTALTRLIEMGIEPFLVASALDCVVAQRLARTLCHHCKARTILPADVLRDHGFQTGYDLEAYEPVGCARCGGSGYKGRIGLYEVMPVTEEIRTLAIERASADRVAAVAVRSGMRRLRDDGLDKVRNGLTSIAEVARVTSSGA
jgi:pilus retraction protein PilT